MTYTKEQIIDQIKAVKYAAYKAGQDGMSYAVAQSIASDEEMEEEFEVAIEMICQFFKDQS